MLSLLRLLLFRCLALPTSEDDLRWALLLSRREVQELKRQAQRPRLRKGFKVFAVVLAHLWPRWKSACHLVKPETVMAWHRQGFRLFWTWKSRKKAGGKRIKREIASLIRRLARENPTWGSPRIHGELLKLGFRVSERTVLRYMPTRQGTERRRQSWRTFLENHREMLGAMDFLVVPTLTFRQIYILVILHHGRRVIAHVNVTANPTAEWVKQQLREAFPFEEVPSYLIFDNDTIFGAVKSFVESMGIKPKQTAFHCPWQNGAVERVFGSLRRELLDHVVVLNEDHLRRLLKDYFEYYHQDRTHLALEKDTPRGRPEENPPNPSAVIDAQPRVGGLHHRYVWRKVA